MLLASVFFAFINHCCELHHCSNVSVQSVLHACLLSFCASPGATMYAILLETAMISVFWFQYIWNIKSGHSFLLNKASVCVPVSPDESSQGTAMGGHKKEGSRPRWNKATVTLIQVQVNQLDVTLDTMDTVESPTSLLNGDLLCFGT